MDKDVVETEYRIEGVVIGGEVIDLNDDKESFVIKRRKGIKTMELKSDGITNVYLR